METCTLVVTYNPTSGGAHSDAIELTFNNGLSSQTSNRNVTGTGLTPAVLSISDESTYDFGSRVITTTGEKILTITNSGTLQTQLLLRDRSSRSLYIQRGSYPGIGELVQGQSLLEHAPSSLSLHLQARGPSMIPLSLVIFDGLNNQTTNRL